MIFTDIDDEERTCREDLEDDLLTAILDVIENHNLTFELALVREHVQNICNDIESIELDD